MESIHEWPYVFEQVLSYLPERDLCSVRRTCKGWYRHYESCCSEHRGFLDAVSYARRRCRKRRMYLWQLREYADQSPKIALRFIFVVANLPPADIEVVMRKGYHTVLRMAIVDEATRTAALQSVSNEYFPQLQEIMANYPRILPRVLEEMFRRRRLTWQFTERPGTKAAYYRCDEVHGDDYIARLCKIATPHHVRIDESAICDNCVNTVLSSPECDGFYDLTNMRVRVYSTFNRENAELYLSKVLGLKSS